MLCCPFFYSSLPDIGAGFRPVEAEDSYEAEQIGSVRVPRSDHRIAEQQHDRREGGPAVVRGVAGFPLASSNKPETKSIGDQGRPQTLWTNSDQSLMAPVPSV